MVAVTAVRHNNGNQTQNGTQITVNENVQTGTIIGQLTGWVGDPSTMVLVAERDIGGRYGIKQDTITTDTGTQITGWFIYVKAGGNTNMDYEDPEFGYLPEFPDFGGAVHQELTFKFYEGSVDPNNLKDQIVIDVLMADIADETPQNGAPGIDVQGTTSFPSDSQGPVSPFAGVTITDTETNDQITLTITFADANGVLVGINGQTIPNPTVANGNKVYSFTGTKDQLTSLLDNVQFDPTDRAAGSGQQTTTFTLGVTDAAHTTPVTSSAVSVVSTAPDQSQNQQPSFVVTAGQSSFPVTVNNAVDALKGLDLGDAEDDTLTLTVSFANANGTLAFTDTDTDGVTLTNNGTDAGGVHKYTLVGKAAALETFLDLARFTATRAGATTFDFTLKDNDHTATTHTGAVTVTATNPVPQNGAPSAPVLTGTAAAEYAAAGTVVGTLSATDPDAGDVLTFSLLDNADGRFTLSGNQILVADGFRLDHEQAASHTIKVKVTDRAGNAKEQSFVIGVTDVNPEVTAGTAGNDVFKGGLLNDVLSGSLGNDRLYGQGGADTLRGEAGHDVLGGGAGKDKLYGGKGAASKDAFVFDTKLTNAKDAPNKSLANKSKDVIYDFGSKYDSIYFDDAAFTNKTIAKYLKNKGASVDKPYKMKSSFFKVGDKATDKDDFFIYNARTKKLYFDVDGSGSKAMVEIASLKLQKGEGTTLTHKDFFFI